MKCWFWLLGKFWWLWGANALVAAGVLLVFLSGVVGGWVNSDNLLPWTIILLIEAAIVGGGWWLRAAGHAGWAVLPLLAVVVAVAATVGGSLLFGAFYVLVYALGNGRMN